MLGVGKIGFGLGLDQPDWVSSWIKIHLNSTRTYNLIGSGSDSGYIGFGLDLGYSGQFGSGEIRSNKVQVNSGQFGFKQFGVNFLCL